MKQSGCFFCEAYKDKEKVIFENNSFYSRFDNFPVSPGHLEVITKRHIDSMFGLSKEEWTELFEGIKESIKILQKTNLDNLYRRLLSNPDKQESIKYLKKALGHMGINKEIDGFNIGINEKKAAGQTIPHLHVHIIPRFVGDEKDPRGGIRKILDKAGTY